LLIPKSSIGTFIYYFETMTLTSTPPFYNWVEVTNYNYVSGNDAFFLLVIDIQPKELALAAGCILSDH
jgi:hypothetical protein